MKISNTVLSDNSEVNTRLVNSFNRQKIVTYGNKTLSEGLFYSLRSSSGMLVRVSDSVEQMDTKVLYPVEPSIQLALVLEGSLNFSLDDHQFEITGSVDKPALSVIRVDKPCVSRRYLSKSSPRLRKVNVLLTESWMSHHPQMAKEWFSGLNGRGIEHLECLKVPCDGELNLLGEEIQHLASRLHGSVSEKELGIEMRVMRLMLHCFQHLKTSSLGPVRQMTSQKSDKLSRIMAYIEAHLVAPPTLSVLAKQHAMSVSQLQRLFKSEANTTAIEYIRLRRLERVRDALIDEKITISEAAYQAGYSHYSNFNTAFKRAFGVTPKTYIKNNTTN
ncbi:helix-turn-helix domain-containing protein [Thaumasiovibrio subtropicus]|uniref:helix-turn-helix domain-containing protein n=1 Tax=Thaumasiovibrio subtropicus TaxID=1891207 RepID=UPI000B34CCD4|nr:AraC family transcriptional regulator [Thaumasiovibrio subtropicus]